MFFDKKIMIIGNFSGCNAGDNIVLESILVELLPFKNCIKEIIVPGLGDNNITNVGNEIRIKRISTSIKKGAFRFFSKDMINELADTDIVLFTAGTLFSRKIYLHNYSFISTFILSYLCVGIRKSKIKLIAYNAEVIVDGNIISNYIFKKIINKFYILQLRNNRFDNGNVIFTRDNVFGYELPTINHSEEIMIGVNIAVNSIIKTDYDWKKNCIDLLIYITTKYKSYRIICFQTNEKDYQTVLEWKNDIGINIDIIDLTKMNYSEIMANYSRIKVFIGMRMHSLIFSMKRSIPFLAIEYDKKVSSFLSNNDMQEFLISFHEYMKLEDMINNILDNYEDIQKKIYDISLFSYYLLRDKNNKLLNNIFDYE